MTLPAHIRSEAEEMLLEGALSNSAIARVLNEKHGTKLVRQNVKYWEQCLDVRNKAHLAAKVAKEKNKVTKNGWIQVQLSDADQSAPSVEGVYVIKNGRGDVIYIGSSSDINRRWKDGHHILLPALRAGGCSLFIKHTENYLRLEQEMIRSYRAAGEPLLNYGS